MQKRLRNFIALIFLSFLSFPPALGQVSQYRLATADSLFEAKRYTQALSKFEGVSSNEEYTPAMLLKMAYIYEGLGNIAKTQYFLNLYFLATNDDSVLDKMEALATSHELEGYEVSDQLRFWLFLEEFKSVYIFVLLGLAALSGAWAIRRKHMNKKIVFPLAVQGLLCLSLLALLQLVKSSDQAIVLQPNTYVMSGPSSGADVLEVIDAGHRVQVLGRKDVWLQVRWRDQEAYLKEELLEAIAL
jgi:hypothetical protein